MGGCGEGRDMDEGEHEGEDVGGGACSPLKRFREISLLPLTCDSCRGARLKVGPSPA